MSFDTAFTLTGLGAVDDSDILRFIPTSTGATTAGTWSWYFDGSDVGLSTNDEDVDAFTMLPNGRLLISTLGNVSVTGASGADEDLLAFTPSQLGSTTSGAWAMYFDGSDVGLSSTSNEDVNGVWVDAAGKIYLTTLGSFSVTGASGDGSDIFTCTPGSLGSTTTCTLDAVLGRLDQRLLGRGHRLAEHRAVTLPAAQCSEGESPEHCAALHHRLLICDLENDPLLRSAFRIYSLP